MTHLSLALLALAVVGCSTSRRSSTPAPTGFIERDVAVNGTAYRYKVYVPPGYDPARRWPVVLFLHGAGERGSDGELQVQVGLAPAIRRAPERVPAIVVFPQAPKDSSWSGTPGRMAIQALDQTMREFRGDPKRVYLTGLSMGGYGTWQLALEHPKRFAALVPICSGVTYPRPNATWLRVTAVPADAPDPYAVVARGVRHIPVWAFHGDSDQAVPVTQSRKMVEALRAAGSPAKYTEYPGVGHNSWDLAYAEPALWDWLFAQRK
jgi:predicted peptidase